MNNEKHNKKEKAKEIAKKVLHVICYILSALFILLMAIVGLQNCKKASGVSAEGDYTSNTYYEYSMPSEAEPTNGQVQFGDYGQYLYWLYNTLGDDTLPTDGSTTATFYLLAHDTRITYTSEGETYYADNIKARYEKHDNQWYLSYVDLCVSVSVPTGGHQYTNVFVWCASNYQTGQVVYNLNHFYMDEYINNRPALFKVIQHDRTSEMFTFNANFNFNSPLGITYDGGYNSVAEGQHNTQYWVTTSTTTIGGTTFPTGGYYYLEVGFTSNGMHFEAIKVYFGLTFDYIIAYKGDGTTQAIPTPSNADLVYYNIRYVDEDGVETIVNRRDRQVYGTDNSITRYLLLNSTTWENDGFRTIYFDEPITQEQKIWLQSFNNNDNSIISGIVYDENTQNVFLLIASAFTGIIPILNIYLLPNITLGALLFIPLVAMIVFAIIRIIKK